jgi:radical SAM superfamily enzyme YgiQ (UPF0313 family)
VSGQLKIAPEHVAEKVTRSMHKPGKSEYTWFIEAFKKTNVELGKDQYLVPYFISAHPGCGLEDTIELAEFVRDHLQYYPEQVQNFTPTPMTVSTCMYYTGINPDNNQVVYIPRQERERKMQRSLLQYRNRANRNLVREALRAANRDELIGSGPNSLVPVNKKTVVNEAPKNTSSGISSSSNKPARQRRKKDMHGR